MSQAHALLLSVVLLLTACAAPRPARAPAGEEPAKLQARVAAHQQDLVAAEVRLEEVLAAAGEPDCAEACSLRESLCGLADRICGIADAHPEDEAVRFRCADARRRCERATERTRARCGCPLP